MSTSSDSPPPPRPGETPPTAPAARPTPGARSAPGRDTTDSFIDEVSEELRRDRLNRAFRRYGPYVGAAIVAVVVGAAVNEWRTSSAVSAAREAGALLAAAEAAPEPAAAFADLVETGAGGLRTVAALAAAGAEAEAGAAERAAELYARVSGDRSLDRAYRDLAALRSVMARLETAPREALLAELALLAEPGAPYRAVAMELQGGLHLAAGDAAAARAALETALGDPTAPQGVRARAQALLDSLGPNPDAAETEPTDAEPTDAGPTETETPPAAAPENG